MKRLLSLFAFCSFSQVEGAVISEKFLDSVAMIESNFNPNAVGDGTKARGAYQLHQGAWIDACKWLEYNDKGQFASFEWSIPTITGNWKKYAHDPVFSRVVAKGYFSLLYYRFKKRGIEPTPIQLYMAYNMGFNGASAHKFKYDSYTLDNARTCILKRANFILSK